MSDGSGQEKQLRLGATYIFLLRILAPVLQSTVSLALTPHRIFVMFRVALKLLFQCKQGGLIGLLE